MNRFTKICSVVGITAGAIFLFAFFANSVGATSSFFLPRVVTATSTTTPSYMTAGTATTTTPVLDAYQNGIPRLVDKAALLIQLSASSTSTVLNTNIEYSDDNIDWWQDSGTINTNSATTTKPFDIGTVNQFKFVFASSTAGLGAVNASQATTTRIMYVNTPTRYVRAVFTLAIGSTPGAVWAEWVPSRQAQQ